VSIEWKRLIDVRERRQQVAREAVARDRRATEEGEAQASAAQAQLQVQIASKASHWQAIGSALDGGACNVAQLHDAGAWSGALDERIAHASRDASQALAIVAERQGVLEASRRQLRSAVETSERARQMEQRVKVQHQRAQDMRIDDAAEEAASQAWAARRSA